MICQNTTKATNKREVPILITLMVNLPLTPQPLFFTNQPNKQNKLRGLSL
jgi:hypothetical protein